MVQNKDKVITDIAEATKNGTLAKTAAKAPEKKELQPSDFRNERKFAIQGFDIAQVEAVVKSHPALFSVPFPPRYINNIYFDTLEFQNYKDNVMGAMNRHKFRIRWYGDQYGQMVKPVLEVKIKRGMAGTKKYVKLKPITLERGFTTDDIRNWLDESDIDPEFREATRYLFPSLLNRYRRKYFLSADKKFRITLDNQLSYTHIPKLPGFFVRREADHDSVIMELKYDTEDDREASRITDHIPFRLSKNSKYVVGVKKLDMWNIHEW